MSFERSGIVVVYYGNRRVPQPGDRSGDEKTSPGSLTVPVTWTPPLRTAVLKNATEPDFHDFTQCMATIQLDT